MILLTLTKAAVKEDAVRLGWLVVESFVTAVVQQVAEKAVSRAIERAGRRKESE